jgi:molecular chaperone HscB
MNLASDDFTLFGLPQHHEMDCGALDARWRKLQAEVHPDRFATEGAAAQRVAMQWAVRVNEGYRRLKDPVQRGAYLCELRGVPVDAERNTAMPAAFLTQQMAWRERLEEAADAAAVERIAEELAASERRELDELRVLLDERGDTAAAAAKVRALMFLIRFRQDIERRLETLDTTR